MDFFIFFFCLLFLTSTFAPASHIKLPNSLLLLVEVVLHAPASKRSRYFSPAQYKRGYSMQLAQRCLPVAVAFLRWKSAVLLKWEKEGKGSPGAPLPTAGPGPCGVKPRPRWAVLWKSFVRSQHLLRQETVLRSSTAKTTTSHLALKGQTLFLPWVFRLVLLPPHPSATPAHLTGAWRR